MDHFKQITTFVQSVMHGSLSAAARAEGVTPAIVGRRLNALESRLGVRLLLRTTRHLTLTFEGQAFFEDCQRVLNDLNNAEAAVQIGGVKVSGHLRLTAPAGFGRRHVASHVATYMDANPEVTVSLSLTDRLVDIINEGIDCAIRIGDLSDSSLVSLRLGDMQRMVVASPDYLTRYGRPHTLADLARHECLSLGQQRGWIFRDPEQEGVAKTLKVNGRFICNDGAVLHDWVLAGRGLAWRSLWEVGEDVRAGRLVTLLDEYAAAPLGIYAVFPQRRQLPLRVRLFIDLLKSTFSQPEYWLT